MAQSPATVYLIGAGPGDPGLLTLRGRECLRRADVVLYDYLAGVRLLEEARPDAELYCLGRHGQGKLWKQDEINQRMISEAQAGRTVARLKGGDPSVFGRLAEELGALTSAGIPFEIVPGVNTSMAAGAYAGVTLTHRDQASCVAFVTGQEQAGKKESALDYEALARFPGTLVIYMGVTTAARWSGELLRHGKPPETPVLLVRRCSLPDQTTVECSLGEVSETLAPKKVRPPLIAIVGDVAQRPEACRWFTGRPLFGQTILVTRPRQQAGAMAGQLRDLGAEVLLQPVIEVRPPEDKAAVGASIDRLAQFDWVVFSSRNGVDFFLESLQTRDLDARALAGVKLAAIGPATAEALAGYSLRTDLQPHEYRAEALAEALANEAAGKRFLLVRASRGRETLGEQLTLAGGQVEQVVVYQSVDTAEAEPSIATQLAEGLVDWTTVTSSAIARSLVRLFGEGLGKTKLAAISPLTAGVLKDAGFEPAVVAKDYTAEGVIRAIQEYRE